MIHDKIKNIDKYKIIIPKKIINQIKSKNYLTDVIELKKSSEKTFELHKFNNDLFLVLSGSVYYQYSFTNVFIEVDEYNDKKDFQKVDTKIFNEIVVKENEFLLIDKNILHKPNLKCDFNNEKVFAEISIIKIKEK